MLNRDGLPHEITKRQGFAQALVNALPDILKTLGLRGVAQDSTNPSIGKRSQQSSISDEDNEALQTFIQELLGSLGTVQSDGNLINGRGQTQAIAKRQGFAQAIVDALPAILKNLGLRDISQDSLNSSFEKRDPTLQTSDDDASTQGIAKRQGLTQAIANALPDILKTLGLRDLSQTSLNSSLLSCVLKVHESKRSYSSNQMATDTYVSQYATQLFE
ncbi:hypothetical protein M7I_6428 [Glarea lozoyensis 74030]|uniref:Uncharacterized protein n=1 Tax=Glarea lozoyensis (strain ATCC 74030 / MF5533) TaxID=1104152 RepID=H0EUJ3_GLAL7|nr:hypothetical protein M7I_6428 [Glarea lozoyensis 74030]